MAKPIPSNAKDFLSCDPDTGKIVWINNPPFSDLIGREWGWVEKSTGYRAGSLNGITYLAHRIAWFLLTGNDPGDLTVDHRDGNRSNNKASNLRLLPDQSSQLRNVGALGYRVKKDRFRKPLEVCFKPDKSGKQIYLGSFMCPLLARLSYHDAAVQVFPDTPFVPRKKIKGNPHIQKIIADPLARTRCR